jgi:cell division septum initiation protein DivIVA
MSYNDELIKMVTNKLYVLLDKRKRILVELDEINKKLKEVDDTIINCKNKIFSESES